MWNIILINIDEAFSGSNILLLWHIHRFSEDKRTTPDDVSKDLILCLKPGVEKAWTKAGALTLTRRGPRGQWGSVTPNLGSPSGVQPPPRGHRTLGELFGE